MPAVCRNSSPVKCWVAPKPGLANENLAGIGLGGRDQRLDVIGREVRSRDDDQAGGRHQRHRIERGERVVAQRLVHRRGDDLAGGHHAERVAVLVGAGDRLVAEGAGGARPVLDHDRLAELFLQRLRDDAADDVGAAAGSERHDDADRTLWPFLRRCTDGAAKQSSGGGGGKHRTSREHRFPPGVQG